MSLLPKCQSSPNFCCFFWCSAWSNGKHHAFLPLVCQVLLWYYCCPNFAQSAPRYREITVWTVYMFAATFFWSRVKRFWEIWNFWNTREPRKTSMQTLGRLNNTIECIVWAESVIMTPDWCADLGSTGLSLLSVKAMKLEHRCWCALFFFSLSLSLSLSLFFFFFFFFFLSLALLFEALPFAFHYTLVVAIVFGRPCNLLLISPCPRLRPLRPAALERLGTNLSAQCYTNFGPDRWSDVVQEFQGILFCRSQM